MMWWTNMFAVLFVIFAVFMMIFYVVDRICRCYETCAIAKAYGDFMARGGKYDDVTAAISGLRKVFEKSSVETKGGAAK